MENKTVVARFLLVLLVLTAQAVFADTIFFKDGTSVDGMAVETAGDTVSIQIGKGRVNFLAADVDRVEKNDKDGDPIKISVQRAKEHQQQLEQRTGLTREQRDKIRDALDPLWSPDEATRTSARNRLIEMGREMPVFQFIETALPFSKGAIAPEMMQLLVELDPKKAQEVVPLYAQNPDPGVRTAALELLAGYKNADHIETLARGMLDPDPHVQASTALALAQSGLKAATPALIEGVRNPDPSVQNACRSALETLWSSGNVKRSARTAEEWTDYWKSQAGSIPDAVDLSSLTPLVTKEELDGASSGHDE